MKAKPITAPAEGRLLAAVDPAPAVRAAIPEHQRQLRLRALVDEHISFVGRTLRRAGVAPSDLDDEIQRTFIVVARRLDDVQPGSERSFLFQVALNTAAHARRNMARRREIPSETVPEPHETFATPEDIIDRKQMRELVDGILGGMHESLRAVFTLYEYDEMNLAQIGAQLGVPRGTVASRLRRARAQFRKHVAAIELAWDLGAAGAGRVDEPPSTWRRKATSFEQALLGAGSSKPVSESAHAKTLAALGLTVSPRHAGGVGAHG